MLQPHASQAEADSADTISHPAKMYRIIINTPLQMINQLPPPARYEQTEKKRIEEENGLGAWRMKHPGGKQCCPQLRGWRKLMRHWKRPLYRKAAGNQQKRGEAWPCFFNDGGFLGVLLLSYNFCRHLLYIALTSAHQFGRKAVLAELARDIVLLVLQPKRKARQVQHLYQ